MKLLIVESPNKVQKLRAILGSGWNVVATGGHIEDLPSKKIGVSEENGGIHFEYEAVYGRSKTIKFLRDAISRATEVFLGTDPDREGEAIAWHVSKFIKGKPFFRITFNAITKKDVLDGLSSPRKIDQNLVNAQQARRAIDRVIGYTLSPLATREIRHSSENKFLSVGRVQSPAISLIRDRDGEIEGFESKPYWKIEAELNANCVNGMSFNAYHPETYWKESEAKKVFNFLGHNFKVDSISSARGSISPPKPLITASLQKAAYYKLRMPAQGSMRTAQGLYEKGFITYPRTDSPWISDDGLKLAREFVFANYGQDFYSMRNFRAKGIAQEAHECIRPTSSQIPGGLSTDEKKLLDLIRKDFFGSQMSDADFEKVTVLLKNNGVPFTAEGKRISFDGFYRCTGNPPAETTLPQIKPGMIIPGEAEMLKKATEPPARYNDASLVETLEKHGIGRPSTYASILKTIKDRGYVRDTKKGGGVEHTEVAGKLVDWLRQRYRWVLDLNYTKSMEENLDRIAEAKMKRDPVIKEVMNRVSFVKVTKSFSPVVTRSRARRMAL